MATPESHLPIARATREGDPATVINIIKAGQTKSERRHLADLALLYAASYGHASLVKKAPSQRGADCTTPTALVFILRFTTTIIIISIIKYTRIRTACSARN
jgi:hypothetical protein